ncbi:MAG TPA: RING finger protein [Anaerolineales bacterium]|nr:RING finger protein [Anaerolineales bacterium]
MTPPDSRPLPRPTIVPRWVGAVFPVVLGAGLIFAGVYGVDRSSLPLAVALAATFGLGLASGLVVRLSMPDRPMGLRWLVALAGSLIGLLTVGLLTGGAIGIQPRREAGETTQWADLAQLVAAGGTSWLALVAWRRKETSLESEGLRARTAVQVPVPASNGGTAGTPPTWSGLASAWQRLQSAWRRPRVPPVVASEPTSTRRRRRRGTDIRLTGAVEHRCPYCLEAVARADPRGVVVCPVCHTPHHADCWAVTGTCQVPHAYRSPS